MNPSSNPTRTEYAKLPMQQLRALGDNRRWEWDDSAGRLTYSTPGLVGASPSEIINLDNMYREWLQQAPASRQDHLRGAATDGAEAAVRAFNGFMGRGH